MCSECAFHFVGDRRERLQRWENRSAWCKTWITIKPVIIAQISMANCSVRVSASRRRAKKAILPIELLPVVELGTKPQDEASSSMPLLSLWLSNPAAVAELTVEQVVATAGDGNLKDGSICSQELQDYLGQVSSEKLSEYVDQCLSGRFDKSGIVLQDLVNELGRRLDYKVINGRYQGTTNAIGFDGIWIAPEGHTIIAEVKTTDAYRR